MCRDYVNGGPCFCPLEVPSEGGSSCRVLARYWQSGAAAAVRVDVGQGRAVLCGSHPEFDAGLLLDGCEGGSSCAIGAQAEYVQHVHELHEGLVQGDNAQKRAAFLRLLFCEVMPS